MIRAPAAVALALGTALAGCQSENRNDFRGFSAPSYFSRPAPVASSPLDGQWASTDGLFVASFGAGRFVSRSTASGVTLAEGSYTIAGSDVRMDWFSIQAKRQTSAGCRLAGPRTVTCQPTLGSPFTLVRT